MSTSNWSDARSRMMLDPNVVNLNSGSLAPTPRGVFEYVTALRKRLAEEPLDFVVRQTPPLLWQARENLAVFLGTDPRRLIFTVNVTAAINVIASTLRLGGTGEILLTDHEYGAMHWCWQRAAQRQGLTLKTFPLPISARSPDEIVDAVRAAFSDRTRLLFFSHILSPTGMVLPAQAICEEARRRGIITVIDGAHAPALLPLRIDEIGCDFYGANCHKWLLAPTGAGFLWFRPNVIDHLQPLQVSWGCYYDPHGADERDEHGSTPRIRSFEFGGMRDVCPWLATPTAIQFQQELGWQAIRSRIRELTRFTREKLGSLAGLRLATPEHPDLHAAMTAFRLPKGADIVTLRRNLWERHRIEIAVVERIEGPLIRVSTHFYNTEDEVTILANALAELL